MAFPCEAVIDKCMGNLAQGVRPIRVALRRGVTVAEEWAKNKTAADRIDVFEIEQFVALNLYEWGQFFSDRQRVGRGEIGGTLQADCSVGGNGSKPQNPNTPVRPRFQPWPYYAVLSG